MSTPWALPTIISQFSEPDAEAVHIAWDNSNNFNSLRNLDSGYIQTVQPLMHIARSPKHDLKNKTYYIRASGFNFINLPASFSGIELKLTTRRYGRITDETIQLCLDEVSIGDNMATLDLNPIKTYGGDSNKWGAEDLSITNIINTSFGVVIRFQSHPNWPHRDPAFIGAVELRIH